MAKSDPGLVQLLQTIWYKLLQSVECLLKHNFSCFMVSSLKTSVKKSGLQGKNSICIKKRKSSLQNPPLKQSSKSPSHLLSWFNNTIEISVSIRAKTSSLTILPHCQGYVDGGLLNASRVALRDPQPSGSSRLTGLGCNVFLFHHFDIGPVHSINRQKKKQGFFII